VKTRDKREKMRTRMLFLGLVLIDVVWGCCFFSLGSRLGECLDVLVQAVGSAIS